MATGNQSTPPVNPSPASSLPQQEKRWTVSDSNLVLFNEKGEMLAILGENNFRAIADAHNATLSEPKPEEKLEEAFREADQVLESLVNEAPVASKAGDAPPQNTLHACPFCGGTNAQLVIPHGGEPVHWAVICTPSEIASGCGASGTWELTKTAAIDRWNQRVAPSVVAGVGEHAIGVSSDEEIAREAALELNRRNAFRVSLALGTKVILAAIRKAKSLSEPKESEEKGSNL